MPTPPAKEPLGGVTVPPDSVGPTNAPEPATADPPGEVKTAPPMLEPALASGLEVFEPVSLVLPADEAGLMPVVPVPIAEEGLTMVARVAAVPAIEPDVLEPVSLLLP